MFSGVLIADKVGVGDQKRDTTIVHEQTLLEAFLNISLRSACFIKEVFSGKNSWDYCLQVLDYQDFIIIRH